MPERFFSAREAKKTDGAKQPRYILAGVAGVDLKVYGQHLRMCELKQIAQVAGAELAALGRGPRNAEEQPY